MRIGRSGSGLASPIGARDIARPGHRRLDPLARGGTPAAAADAGPRLDAKTFDVVVLRTLGAVQTAVGACLFVRRRTPLGAGRGLERGLGRLRGHALRGHVPAAPRQLLGRSAAPSPAPPAPPKGAAPASPSESRQIFVLIHLPSPL